jgi:hypothetical protein
VITSAVVLFVPGFVLAACSSGTATRSTGTAQTGADVNQVPPQPVRPPTRATTIPGNGGSATFTVEP